MAAFSPGFLALSKTLRGQPRVFISHGRNDPVLPFSTSRDVIVPILRSGGYDVTFHEFDGGHVVPAEVSEAALDWLG